MFEPSSSAPAAVAGSQRPLASVVARAVFRTIEFATLGEYPARRERPPVELERWPARRLPAAEWSPRRDPRDVPAWQRARGPRPPLLAPATPAAWQRLMREASSRRAISGVEATRGLALTGAGAPAIRRRRSRPGQPSTPAQPCCA